jgi:hypothetical protein
MGFPKKIKKNIPLNYPKTLFPRREELVDKINQDGTFLPKSILHADLDRGFMDFVRDELKLVVDGTLVPVVDIIITTQNWAQFTETWNFVDLDFNVKPPFITTVRTPEVKFGTNPALIYNIPNRRQYFYATVPTWDGKQLGADVYKIPQPIPVDITYQVKIVCNRMRELNSFNQKVLGKFASRQAYATIKGHYIPIIWNNISDESVMDLDKRKYYVQSYEFIMLGFLIDEEEFTVSPAVNRLIQVFETDGKIITKKTRGRNEPQELKQIVLDFPSGTTEVVRTFNLTDSLSLINTTNVLSFDVYIDNDYYGSDLTTIQISTNDNVKFIVTKSDNTLESTITFESFNNS